MKTRKLLLIILILLGARPWQAAAHGIGNPQRINVPSGPYLLSIWTDPEPLRVDDTHVTVAVMKPETREPIVVGVEVSVRLQSTTDPVVTQTAVAKADNSTNRLLYTAIFNALPEAGRWQGIVSVVGNEGAGEDIPFSIEILPPQPVNWLRYGIYGLVSLLFGWFVWSSWKATSREQPLRRRKNSDSTTKQDSQDKGNKLRKIM